jgi:glycosyltransferase involved in cell wall biosynthesis
VSEKVLRLGLVGPLPPPNGGMAMQTQQLARLLGEEGIDVELVQTNAPYRPEWIEKVKGLRALFRLLPYLWRIWSLVGRVDVIHLMANSGWSWQLFAAPVIWIGWLRGRPVIVNYRGGDAREYMAGSFAWVKPSMAKASKLVVPSGFLQQVFSEFGIASAIIPNIIDLETFYPVPRVAIPASTGAPFTIVITRNLEPIYGLDTAIRAIGLAIERINTIQLKIAGSGPQQDELEQLVQTLDLGSKVTFLGRLGRKEIVELYQCADVMLNPSRVDNMPNSILEALACGIPVISTNVGGVPFMVRDGHTAVLVKPDNVPEMAEAIVNLCRDEVLRRGLSKSGQREVARYTWAEVKPQWLALYTQCGAAA